LKYLDEDSPIQTSCKPPFFIDVWGARGCSAGQQPSQFMQNIRLIFCDWTPDAQAALSFDSSIEYKFIRDPAVVQLTNSSYLMAYATPIP